MAISLSLIQVIFAVICILFSVTLTTQYLEGGWQWINIAVGLIGGCILSGFLYGVDLIFRRFNLRSFNIVTLGLLFGYLMGQAVLFLLNGVTSWETSQPEYIPLRFLVYLAAAYLGVSMTIQATEEIRVSIPFIEFKQASHKKKDILVDLTILADPRIIDLASTGLLDYHLIIPRFAVKELYSQAESGDEMTKAKARRHLEIIKKLEALPNLGIRYVDTDFPECKDNMAKFIRLARYLDTHIITSEINRIQQSSIEGVRIINVHMLSNALKPITHAGESINIKIQRQGKEPLQGVGYLDDGTMVVVNGGGLFINKTIKAYVLSVKNTSSGRLIFCNAAEEDVIIPENDYTPNGHEFEQHKTFLTL